MSHSPSLVPSYALALTIGPVYTMVSAPTATTTVAPESTGAIVLHGGLNLQHPFNDGIFYRGVGVGVWQIQDTGEKSQQFEQPTGKMLTHQESAMVRLQAAAARPPSVSAGAGDARSAADSALHLFAAPPSCSSPRGGP